MRIGKGFEKKNSHVCCSAASHGEDPLPVCVGRAAVGVAGALLPGVPERGLVAAGHTHLVEEGEVHGQGQGAGERNTLSIGLYSAPLYSLDFTPSSSPKCPMRMTEFS